MSPWSPAWLAPLSNSQTLNSSLCYSEKRLLAVTASAGWKLPWAREVKTLKCLSDTETWGLEFGIQILQSFKIMLVGVVGEVA